MEGHLTLSKKERERLVKFEEVKAGRMTLRMAAGLLGLSYRQAKRSYKRFGEQGAKGLVHGRRGRGSNRRAAETLRTAAVARYRERYADFGPTLAAEQLAKEDIVVDHETLRRWLLASGDWKVRRQRRAHRTRRQRRPRFGELVQTDGSHHAWFDQDDRRYCLMNLVDDATGISLCVMGEEETTDLAMRALWLWIERYGIPQALYTDRKNVFITDREPTLEEQIAAKEPLTAFGEACEKLHTTIIAANSPQAKGRVERSHGIYQDRLVKLLKLNGITCVEDANRFLQNGFMDELNQKFAKTPLDSTDAHRPVPKGMDLAQVFCFEERRTVMNDWCIRHENTFYQIHKDNRPLPRPKDKVVLRIRLDGIVELLYRDRPVTFDVLPGPPQHKAAPTPVPQPVPAAPKPKVKPAANHPWRRAARTRGRL
jgi:transposase